MSLWAMLAAPLFASCDLRAADREMLAILAAPGVLAIDQDPLGRPGSIVGRHGPVDTWQRPLSGGASGVALVNRSRRSRSLRLDWPQAHGGPPSVEDAWTDCDQGDPPGHLTLAPHATALFRVALEAAPGQLLVKVR
jgi:alpha-galactosidase